MYIDDGRLFSPCVNDAPFMAPGLERSQLSDADTPSRSRELSVDPQQ